MDHHAWLLVAIFFMSVLVSTLSAATGSAGGIIMTPFFIWLGLTPQQTIATGKFASFGLSIGAIAAFRHRVVKEKKSLISALILLAATVGIISAIIFQRIENATLQVFIGFLMLLMIPAIWEEKTGKRKRKTSRLRQKIGYASLAAVLLMQGVFGGGVGTLLSAVLIYFFGTAAIEANMLQRILTLVLNVVIVTLLVHTNLIFLDYGSAGLLGALVGGFLGSKIALQKGEQFAKVGLMIFMAIAGISLIATAK